MQWIAATAFWVFITVLYDLQVLSLPRPANEEITIQFTLVWTSAFYLVWIPFTVAIWRLTERWTFTQIGWLPFLLRHLGAAVITAALHSASVALVASAIAGANGEALGEVIFGQLRTRIYLQVIVYSGIVAAGEAMSYYGRWRDRDAQAARLEAQLSAARLDALQTQLRPHFLFNSLHAIASLVRDDPNADAVRLISALSDLLRRVLEVCTAEIALGDEVDLVRRYVEIQKARFECR